MFLFFVSTSWKGSPLLTFLQTCDTNFLDIPNASAVLCAGWYTLKCLFAFFSKSKYKCTEAVASASSGMTMQYFCLRLLLSSPSPLFVDCCIVGSNLIFGKG